MNGQTQTRRHTNKQRNKQTRTHAHTRARTHERTHARTIPTLSKKGILPKFEEKVNTYSGAIASSSTSTATCAECYKKTLGEALGTHVLHRGGAEIELLRVIARVVDEEGE